ncbi:MAG: flagellin [Rhizobiaceae bacterium]|nr:flagellin [Rhizobiaceae bacterium]
MSSLNTNSAAMTALQSLRMTNAAMAHTQTAIATGFRVAQAKDNAAYWSIATTMRSDHKAMSTVKDALGLGSATVDVAYTAMESAIKVTDEIKAKLVAAREPGVDRNKIQAEVSELQATLTSIASSASFTGENWLSVDSSDTGYNATKSIVSSFIRDGAVVSIGTTDITLTDLSLFDANGQLGLLDKDRTSGTTTDTVVTLDISALTDSTADVTELEDLIQIVDDAIQDMADGATSLGAISSRIDLQKDFVSDLMDAFQRGIGQLVDADMNAESVRLQALQTQQQLGIQALSIANGSGQNILALFRG